MNHSNNLEKTLSLKVIWYADEYPHRTEHVRRERFTKKQLLNLLITTNESDIETDTLTIQYHNPSENRSEWVVLKDRQFRYWKKERKSFDPTTCINYAFSK